MSTKIFPIILIIIQFCSAAVYAFHADARMAVYWLSAAVLNICVTIN